MSPSDERLHAPATERNRQSILEVLRRVLPTSGLILEVASGSGEHAVHFARALPALRWQPSDPSADARDSISAWTETESAETVLPPLALDAATETWPLDRADAIVCINMVHISPWEATEGLMRGAGHLLPPGAPLILYGPYRRAGQPLEPSNAAFDLDLKRRDARWGLREVEAVAQCAQAQGLRLDEIAEMPANNLTLVFRRL